MADKPTLVKAEIRDKIFERRDIEAREKIILLALLQRMKTHDLCAWPSIATLADDAGLGLKGTRAGLKTLEAWGVLHREPTTDDRGRGADRFTLLAGRLMDAAPWQTLPIRVAPPSPSGSAQPGTTPLPNKEGPPCLVGNHPPAEQGRPPLPGWEGESGKRTLELNPVIESGNGILLPPTPLQGDSGTSPDGGVEVSATKRRRGKRAKTDGEPAGLPGSLSSIADRPDARMWGVLWTKVKNPVKPFILEIVTVWDAYRATFPERRVLDDDGANKIGEALALGYPVEDLCAVPAGAKLSSWHMGQNDRGRRYIDPVSLYREAKTIDAHLERSRTKGQPDDSRMIGPLDGLGRMQESMTFDEFWSRTEFGAEEARNAAAAATP